MNGAGTEPLAGPVGNDLWGVALAEDQTGDRIVLASDRDLGYVFRYTG